MTLMSATALPCWSDKGCYMQRAGAVIMLCHKLHRSDAVEHQSQDIRLPAARACLLPADINICCTKSCMALVASTVTNCNS